jgi:hypothetical protein
MARHRSLTSSIIGSPVQSPLRGKPFVLQSNRKVTMADRHRRDDSPPSTERNGTRGGEESHENGERKTTFADDDSDKVVGSPAIRPIFMGNLMPDCTTEDVTRLFENPAGILPSSSPVLERTYRPFPVDHVDLKRGFCFVFLKDATSQSLKNEIDAFVEVINGM